MSFDHGLGLVSENVLIALRKDIAAGIFPHGSIFPTEKELEKRFGVSRNTVRRAIARLSGDGLLVPKRGVGTIVTARPVTPPGVAISVMGVFREPLAAIQRHALAHGALVCIYAQDAESYDPQNERRFLERVRADRHRLLLAFCSPVEPRNDDLLDAMAEEGTRVVHIEYSRPEMPKQEYTLPDYRKGGYQATVEVLIAGWREVRYLGTAWAPQAERLFADGFRDALAGHREDLSPDACLLEIQRDDSAPERAIGWVRSLLRDLPRPVALVCGNVGLATTAREAARQEGLAVGEDLGLISGTGFADSLDVAEVDRVDYERTGAWIRVVDETLTPEAREPIREWIAPRLVRRGSLAHSPEALRQRLQREEP